MKLGLRAVGFVLALWVIGGAWQGYHADCQFLIPEGYVGPVVVVFNHPSGIEGLSWWRKPVYEVPAGGVLRIAGPLKHPVCINPRYWWVDGQGRRTPLRETDDRPPSGAASVNAGSVSA